MLTIFTQVELLRLLSSGQTEAGSPRNLLTIRVNLTIDNLQLNSRTQEGYNLRISGSQAEWVALVTSPLHHSSVSCFVQHHCHQLLRSSARDRNTLPVDGLG